MFKKFTNGCVRVVNCWLPHPFLFAIILSIVVFIAAMIGTQQGPLELVWAWGSKGTTSDGFWGLLSFSMQMALVLVLGSAMASANVCKRALGAIADAASGAAGILLQFPFYAGIMGLMVAANADGVSLASIIAHFFTNISDNITFPLLTFLSAGIINFFVPSGGGQWAVQAPIVMPAATEMGIEYGRAAMAIAWGDQWTNMIQPFWALPALGIAGLSARNIMGYLVIVTIFTGIVACGGFLLWGMFF